MAHHRHRHIKREKSKMHPIWIRELTKEESAQMDADALLMSLGKYMPPLDNNVKRPQMDWEKAVATTKELAKDLNHPFRATYINPGRWDESLDELKEKMDEESEVICECPSIIGTGGWD